MTQQEGLDAKQHAWHSRGDALCRGAHDRCVKSKNAFLKRAGADCKVIQSSASCASSRAGFGAKMNKHRTGQDCPFLFLEVGVPGPAANLRTVGKGDPTRCAPRRTAFIFGYACRRTISSKLTPPSKQHLPMQTRVYTHVENGARICSS